MARPHRILLLTDDQQRTEQWQRSLGSSFEIQQPGALEASPAEFPDLILTDHLPITHELGQRAIPLQLGEIGVVAVGVQGPADVVLVGACTGREIRLACRLLAQVVRLRRQRNGDKRKLRELEQLAFTDSLTGLPNRRVWDRELAKRLEKTHRSEAPGSLCVALLDLDYFKRVNDRMGYVAGDSLLRAVAGRLQSTSTDTDVITRLGGDEFAAAGRVNDNSDAVDWLERIRRSVQGGSAVSGGSAMSVTASAGFLVIRPGQLCSTADVMAAVSNSLRAAKSLGRDRAVAGSLGQEAD